jgi:chromosome partitioning protein
VIDLIKGKTNPFIESRVLITMFDQESTAAKMICTKLKQMYAAMSYSTIIELDPRMREAQIMSMPVLQYNQSSKAGRQYFRLSEEILGMQPGNK